MISTIAKMPTLQAGHQNNWSQWLRELYDYSLGLHGQISSVLKEPYAIVLPPKPIKPSEEDLKDFEIKEFYRGEVKIYFQRVGEIQQEAPRLWSTVISSLSKASRPKMHHT